MFIEKIGVETGPPIRVEHQAADEVIKRNDGEGLGDEDCFRFSKKFQAAGCIRLSQSAVEERVVGGIGPAGSVVAPACNKAVEEGVGIIVIPDPTGAGDIEIQFIE